MNKYKIKLTLFLIIAHLQLETAYVMEHIPALKSYVNEYIDPFISEQYVFPVIEGQPAGIQRKWWIKYCCNDLYRIIVFFVMCKVALSYSFMLFRVCLLFFLYQVVDHIMLWWNYRSSGWIYLMTYATIFLGILSMLLPENKKAIVKSLK